MLSTNVNPYYDDSENAIANGYHKILFVPGNPVQARELTQIQSILQNQIKMHGDHVFKNGTMVIPGNVYYDAKITSLAVNSTQDGVNISSFLSKMVGQEVVGQINGVKAKVVFYANSTDSEPGYLFVKYTSGSESVQTFIQGEILTSVDSAYSVTLTSSTNFQGQGSLFHVNEGVFYINGYFVGVDSQTVIVSKTGADSVTATVGLVVNDSIVTAKDDPSLYDTAMGFSNYSAPGADRYKISLDLSTMTEVSTIDETKFIKLMDIVEGEIAYLNNKTKYSEIEKMLARRTFDESGNFVVDTNISISARHTRNNFRGQWVTNTYYLKGDVVTYTGTDSIQHAYYTYNSGFSGATPPTHVSGIQSDGALNWTQTTTPYVNNGVSTYSDPTLSIAADDTLQVKISPIKAYVQGFEVSSANTFIQIPKSRTIKYKTLNQSVPTGQFVSVTNLVGELNIGAVVQGLIKNASSATIGTCWIRSIEYDTGTPGSAGVYRLYIFGLAINNGSDFVTQAKTIVAGGFTATFNLKEQTISGVVNATSSATISGKNTRFTSELTVGSTVKIGATSYTVASISNDYSMTISSPVTVVDATVTKLIVNYINKSTNYLIPLPDLRIYSMRNSNNVIDMTYTVSKYVNLGTASGTSITTTLVGGNESFVNTNNHIVFNTTDNVPVNASFAYSGGNTQLIISGLTNAKTYSLIGIVQRVADSTKEKQKTIKSKTFVLDQTKIYDTFDSSTISTAYNFSSASFPATEGDVIGITSIKMSGGDPSDPYNTVGEVDISDRYYCIGATTNEYYGIATLRLKDPAKVPSAPIKVQIEYYDHSSGDFFNKNSYDSVPEERIPMYPDQTMNMGSFIDFRSRMSDDGVNFTNSGSNISCAIYSQSTITASYSYYLPRYDLICLGKDGQIKYVLGTPGDFSQVTYPSSPPDALVIAKVFMPPNMLYPRFEYITEVQRYKRYTMYDIGRLDDRLSNVEQYVSLSLLEKSANDVNVKDENGLTRFKNGFVVDSFTDSAIADIKNPDFKADLNNVYDPSVLRPPVVTDYIQCLESSTTTDVSRLQNKYQVTGNIASLPYTVVTAIDQTIASSSEFINPFDVVIFEGDVQMFPDQDIWEQRSITNRDVYI